VRNVCGGGDVRRVGGARNADNILVCKSDDCSSEWV
jgi:hypothetical protein